MLPYYNLAKVGETSVYVSGGGELLPVDTLSGSRNNSSFPSAGE